MSQAMEQIEEDFKQARTRAELDRLEDQARFGEGFHKQVKFSQLVLKNWYKIDELERTMSTFGETVIVTLEFDGGPRNLFLSKYYAKEGRYTALVTMLNTSNADLMFCVDRIVTGRDGKTKPFYDFKCVMHIPPSQK